MKKGSAQPWLAAPQRPFLCKVHSSLCPQSMRSRLPCNLVHLHFTMHCSFVIGAFNTLLKHCAVNRHYDRPAGSTSTTCPTQASLLDTHLNQSWARIPMAGNACNLQTHCVLRMLSPCPTLPQRPYVCVCVQVMPTSDARSHDRQRNWMLLVTPLHLSQDTAAAAACVT